LRKILALLFSFLAVVLQADGQVTSAQCSGLKDTPPKADKLLPMISLTPADIEQIKKERTCIKSYGFPGGEDALLKASSSEFRSDLQHLQELFDKPSEVTKDMPASDQERVSKIKAGWSREQVLLWGHFNLLRKLNTEKQYDQMLMEVARIRNEFGLGLAPLNSWDNAQANTYFSPQALRNMIVAFEYAAKGNLTPASGPERDELVKSYLAVEPTLEPTMIFHHSAARAVLTPVCGAHE
jgi:hypothetical protein